jgi:hypothetical protein
VHDALNYRSLDARGGVGRGSPSGSGDDCNSKHGLTVTVALPDTATATSPFTVSETIANTTARAKIAWVTQTLKGPTRTFSLRYPLFVPAQRALSLSFTFPLPSVPPGTYTLTLTANTASATASTVVS